MTASKQPSGNAGGAGEAGEARAAGTAGEAAGAMNMTVLGQLLGRVFLQAAQQM